MLETRPRLGFQIFKNYVWLLRAWNSKSQNRAITYVRTSRVVVVWPARWRLNRLLKTLLKKRSDYTVYSPCYHQIRFVWTPYMKATPLDEFHTATSWKKRTSIRGHPPVRCNNQATTKRGARLIDCGCWCKAAPAIFGGALTLACRPMREGHRSGFMNCSQALKQSRGGLVEWRSTISRY
jgi:hypothetical protein